MNTYVNETSQRLLTSAELFCKTLKYDTIVII